MKKAIKPVRPIAPIAPPKAKPEPIPTVEVRNIGLGTMRSAGTYIGLLLQLEHAADRVSVLVDVMENLNITPEDIADRFYAKSCDHCGSLNSPKHPCECNR